MSGTRFGITLTREDNGQRERSHTVFETALMFATNHHGHGRSAGAMAAFWIFFALVVIGIAITAARRRNRR
jgi:hypothetical protein